MSNVRTLWERKSKKKIDREKEREPKKWQMVKLNIKIWMAIIFLSR